MACVFCKGVRMCDESVAIMNHECESVTASDAFVAPDPVQAFSSTCCPPAAGCPHGPAIQRSGRGVARRAGWLGPLPGRPGPGGST
jgi:hypothetical protein